MLQLIKPLESDIYNISVFNSNSTAIEEAVNKNETDIGNTSDSLTKLKTNVLPFYDKTEVKLNVDTTIEQGIYKTLDLSYSASDENWNSMESFLVVLDYDSKVIQLLFFSDLIYTRTYTKSQSTWSEWLQITAKIKNDWAAVVTSVFTDLSNDLVASYSLVKELKDSSINVNLVTSTSAINIDNLYNTQILINDNELTTPLTGTFPKDGNANKDHFILFVLGKDQNNSVAQIYFELTYNLNNMYIRSKLQSDTEFSGWTSINNISSGGGEGGITISLVNL